MNKVDYTVPDICRKCDKHPCQCTKDKPKEVSTPMDKIDWANQKKILINHLENAEKNKKTALAQIEELSLTISAYDEKLKSFSKA